MTVRHPINLVLAAILVTVSFAPQRTSAQSNADWGRALGNLLGGAINATLANSVRKAWLQTDPEIQTCLISVHKIRPARLAEQGIGPRDARVQPYVQDCVTKLAMLHARSSPETLEKFAAAARQLADAEAEEIQAQARRAGQQLAAQTLQNGLTLAQQEQQRRAQEQQQGQGASTGSSGSTGTSGSAGSYGSTGSRSSTTASGSTGTSGATGSYGSTGSNGSTSTKGSTGTSGSTSASGSTGTSGTTGSYGSTGSNGSTSTKGSTGTSGSTTASGSTGTSGATGSHGSTGSNGSTSTKGSTATSGSSGTSSSTSSSGSTGTPGSTASYGSTSGNGSTSGKNAAGPSVSASTSSATATKGSTASSNQMPTNGPRGGGVPAASILPSPAKIASPGPKPSIMVAALPQYGSLAIAITGLPAGAGPSVSVSSSKGSAFPLPSSYTLKNLAPDMYTLTAMNVPIGGTTYAPTPAIQTKTVSANNTAQATIRYVAIAKYGTLDVTISGLPTGAPGKVTVTAPNGSAQSLSASGILKGLSPGTYTLTAWNVTYGGSMYASAPSSQTRVMDGDTTAHVTISYAAAPQHGMLEVAIVGLPSGVPGKITVTAPNGSVQPVSASETLRGLSPGTYTLIAANVAYGGVTYASTSPSQTKVLDGDSTAHVTISYAAAPQHGMLEVTIVGLPSGVPGKITVTAPNGSIQPVSASETLRGLSPGTYTLIAANVAYGGVTYASTSPSQTKVLDGDSTAHVTISYAATPQHGLLEVAIAGLPSGVSGKINVTAPDGSARFLSAPGTLEGLLPGIYTLTAANVVHGGSTYASTSPTQTKTVSPDTTARATISYAMIPSSAPRITGFAGLPWTYEHCSPGRFLKMLLVGYVGRGKNGTNGVPQHIVVSGINLGAIHSASTSQPGYMVTLGAVSATSLTLDIRATLAENVKPAANFPLTFKYGASSTYETTISQGVMPSLSYDDLGWGQCTWWVGMARVSRGLTLVSYGTAAKISGDPANHGFPQTHSVIMSTNPRSDPQLIQHMAFVEGIKATSSTNGPDGSVTIVYTIQFSEYNHDCGATFSRDTTTMTVVKSKGGAYAVTVLPVAGHTKHGLALNVDAVQQ
jgi:hypothetical protein